jgi:uroporphyrin-III C-methyltransferase
MEDAMALDADRQHFDDDTVLPPAGGAPRLRLRRRPRAGTVALVGAGPGDPELLTVKAVRLLGEADVVLVDALVDPRILAYVRSDARIVDVGKTPGGRTVPQETTNALLVAEAQAGNFVVRLKGGDPFVFGRGGEEAMVLVEHGIPVDIVPGISSSLAVPALVGVPVTHRGTANHVTILTGTSADGSAVLEDTWELAAKSGGTLVFLMAMHCLDRVVARVLAAGRAPTTPALVVRSASQDAEVKLTADLATLVARVAEAGIASPAVVVIGDVVALPCAADAARWSSRVLV